MTKNKRQNLEWATIISRNVEGLNFGQTVEIVNYSKNYYSVMPHDSNKKYKVLNIYLWPHKNKDPEKLQARMNYLDDLEYSKNFNYFNNEKNLRMFLEDFTVSNKGEVKF